MYLGGGDIHLEVSAVNEKKTWTAVRQSVVKKTDGLSDCHPTVTNPIRLFNHSFTPVTAMNHINTG